MWSGRFSEPNAEEMDEFNNSLKFDSVLYTYDILGSIAHVKMLAKQGIISDRDAASLVEALDCLRKDLDDGKVAGMGTHDELLSSCDTYREIYESQYGKEEDYAKEL